MKAYFFDPIFLTAVLSGLGSLAELAVGGHLAGLGDLGFGGPEERLESRETVGRWKDFTCRRSANVVD